MIKIQKKISLKNYSTFKIGGMAEYFTLVKNTQEIIEAINFAYQKGIPRFILGGGSNILFPDKGYKGLVIKVKSSKFKVQSCADFIEHPRQSRDNSRFKVVCGSGFSLAKLVSESVKNNLSGLEWAIGIPGTVGGAIRGNAGAFGHSISEVVKSIKVLKVKNSRFQVVNFKNEECKFDYRESVFKNKKNLIIIEAELEFTKKRKKGIKKMIKENLVYRKKHQPLDYPSAGSIFKNQKSKIKNQKLIREFPELNHFNKRGEIPAAYLVDECNLKGKKIGKAQISKKHSNFIINTGDAKAKDVKGLINLIKKKVREKFGIRLEEEIVIV